MDAEEIERMVNQLQLVPEKEMECFILPVDLEDLGQTRLGSSLVAKVFSPKVVNKETFRIQMPRIFQALKHIDVKAVGEIFFLLDFKSLIDRRRALLEGPWNFFKDLVVFKEPTGLQKPADIPFDEVTVWVQLHNLPLDFMYPDIIRSIGGRIGKIIEVDTDEKGNVWELFLGFVLFDSYLNLYKKRFGFLWKTRLIRYVLSYCMKDSLISALLVEGLDIYSAIVMTSLPTKRNWNLGLT